MGSRTREAREKNGRKADPSVTAAPRRRRGLRMALTGAALLALWWFLPPWMARRALKSAGLPVTSSIALAGFGVSAHQLVLTPSPVQFCGCCAAPAPLALEPLGHPPLPVDPARSGYNASTLWVAPSHG